MGSNKIKNFPNSKISQLEGGEGGVRKFGNVSQIILVINYEGFPKVEWQQGPARAWASQSAGPPVDHHHLAPGIWLEMPR